MCEFAYLLTRRHCPGVGSDEIALKTKLRARVSDGIVQAAIERAKFIDLGRGIAFDGEIGDGLAEVPVVMDDLVDGER